MQMFPIILGVLLILALWRRLHLRYYEQKFKYELYAFRDELRISAATNKIDADSWLFNYFDESLSKRIANSYHLTLFQIIALNLKYSSDEGYVKFREKLNNEIDENEYFKEFQTKMNNATINYLNHQHYVSVDLIIAPIVRLVVGPGIIFSNCLRWVRNLWSLPTTSAGAKYYTVN